jgi:hypothetical protein
MIQSIRHLAVRRRGSVEELRSHAEQGNEAELDYVQGSTGKMPVAHGAFHAKHGSEGKKPSPCPLPEGEGTRMKNKKRGIYEI